MFKFFNFNYSSFLIRQTGNTYTPSTHSVGPLAYVFIQNPLVPCVSEVTNDAQSGGTGCSIKLWRYIRSWVLFNRCPGKRGNRETS